MAKEFGNKNSTKVLVILIGISIVYQGMYHLCITLPFSMEETFAQQRSPALAKAIHPCHGAISNEAQCTESELFRSWSQLQDVDAMKAEEAVVPNWIDDEDNKGPDLMALDPIGNAILVNERTVPFDVHSNSTFNSIMSTPQAASEPRDPPVVVEPKMEFVESTSESNDSLSVVEPKVGGVKPASESSDSLAVVEPKVEFVKTTPAVVEQPQRAGAEDASTGFENMYVSKLIKGSGYESTEWGWSLIELEGQLEDLRKKYEDKQRRRLANSNLNDHVAGVKDRSLLEKIDDLLREMCEEPWRRDRETCARFLTPQERHEAAKAKLQSRLQKIAEDRLQWERSFVQRAKNIGKQMCADSRRQGDAVCEPFLADVPTSAPGRILSMAFARDPIMLSAAEQGQRNSPTTIEGKVLRASKWAAKIPKVACVMAVPNATHAHAQVKYAINSFREQSYEGPSQLIMVYNYEDQQTAHLLNKFADGVYIKALPAQTSVPSTTALRYGAWVAGNDADVVARWDLDTWHHPQRLAMQVRALGLTGLPVSLLHRRTLFADDGHTPVMYLENGFQGTSSVGFGWPESLVAERSWAEKNWHPYLVGEWASLAAAPGLVSLLDMPELQAYSVDDSLEHAAAGEKVMHDADKEHEHAPAEALFE